MKAWTTRARTCQAAAVCIVFGFLVACGSSGGPKSSDSPISPPPMLVSISVTPLGASIPPQTTLQFRATGTYSDRSTQDITAGATWRATGAATINSAGLATGVSPGDATITAAQDATSGTASLTITNPIVSIVVTPSSPSVPAETTVQFAASGWRRRSRPGRRSRLPLHWMESPVIAS